MSKLKNLRLIFHRKPKPTAASSSSRSSPAFDATLKRYITALDTSSPLSPKYLPQSISQPPNAAVSTSVLSSFLDHDSEVSVSDCEDEDPLHGIVSILQDRDGTVHVPPKSQEKMEDRPAQTLAIPWYLTVSNNSVSQRRKEMSRLRKQKHVFKSTQGNRFKRLVSMCGQKLGSKAFVEVIGKLGRESGEKEYVAVINLSMDEARASYDEDVILDKIATALQHLKLMKDQGFQLDEKAYGPILMYLIDMSMAQEFDYIFGEIKSYCPTIHAQLGYYEMLLYIGVDDEEKIQELCNYVWNNKTDDSISSLKENYFLALCEKDRLNELLQISDIIDITKVSFFDHMVTIFKSLGRLSLESLAIKFLLALKAPDADCEIEDISALIFTFASSAQNLAVEDAIILFKNLHSAVDVAPSADSYKKLISYCCECLKVHAALDIVDEMCKEGLTLSVGMLNSILRASEESFDFNLVQRIYSMICRHKLKIDSETFRSMISLKVKMKDYAGAYDMLDEVKDLKFTPTTSMFNAIMTGYFREKNIIGAIMVLEKMKLAGVKPDSQTYSLLITNCNSEDELVKYYEELRLEGVLVTKQIFMACINAYASFGLFEKAKQVLLDEGISAKYLNELKSVLLSALASHGQISDALDIYKEIKEAGGTVEPKAVISLIDKLQPEGDHSRMVELLDEISDPNYWVDACMRLILFLIRTKHLNVIVNLLKQLEDRFSNNEVTVQAAFEEIYAHIADAEPVDLQLGLDLLKVMKKEMHMVPSRKSLDFLLSACAKAKDLDNSLLIWREYEAAGYPYNAMNYLKMYQALLASGGNKAAKKVLAKIPKDDSHNRMIIKACQKTFMPTLMKGKKKKKKLKEPVK